MTTRLIWQINGGRAFLEGRRVRKLYMRPALDFQFDFIEYSDEPEVVALKFVGGKAIPLNAEEQRQCLLWLLHFFEVDP